MIYCKNCVLPDTKPDLSFDEKGICNACNNFKNRENIDWDKRKEEFLSLIEEYKTNENWDCIVPVSGGKDSTFQVIKLLELGVKPLCVTSTTCDLSDLGRKNIENIKNLGVDYIEFSPNPAVRRKLNRIGLMEVGDISWPEHIGIFTIPIRASVNYNVPLVIWGENSQNEYGGPAFSTKSKTLDRSWLEEFGGLLGLRIRDISDNYGVDHKDLLPYVYPTEDEVKNVGVTGMFLGYFIEWDGYKNAEIAKQNGFTVSNEIISGSIVNYENLDNYQTGIHDYFKFLKFGFGRSSDIASMHIRRNMISRQEAVEKIKINDGKYPSEYLGKKLEDILENIKMTVEEFDLICNQFTNKLIFETDKNDEIIKDSSKRPVKKFNIY
tara:strand:- start:9421 stop:10560 length:1140 start_codon:yes stop_codon:yes gene_type:complete